MGLQAFHGLATDIVSRYPSVSAAEVTEAEATIAAELKKARPQGGAYEEISIATYFVSMIVLLLIVWNLISAAIMPGGVTMRMLGLAVVTRDGKEVGRLRSVMRVFTAWSPTIVMFALVWIAITFRPVKVPDGPPLVEVLGLGLALVLPIIGAVWTIAHPARGLHDRAMGTWVVPR
jgi:hypothetical protein